MTNRIGFWKWIAVSFKQFLFDLGSTWVSLSRSTKYYIGAVALFYFAIFLAFFAPWNFLMLIPCPFMVLYGRYLSQVTHNERDSG